MITIIDYGMGNVGSVENMLNKNGFDSIVTRDHTKIRFASHIILPGVGSFDAACTKLSELELDKTIHESVQNGANLLGICLGAQLLLESSEEGSLSGLGFIKGTCKRFDSNELHPLKVPHMGWSDVQFETSNPLAKNIVEPRFYFVHSYYFQCYNRVNVFGKAHHGHSFDCAIRSGNVYGVQFHPEKSHMYGAKLLANFASL